MNKKIYVAGKFKDENIPIQMKYLEDRGFKITHNWTEHKGISPEVAAYYDIEGVKKCDVLIAVMSDPTYEYRGTFTEIGCAIGLNKRIIIVNPNIESKCKELCFYNYPTIKHVSSISEAVSLLSSKLKFLIIGPGGHGKDTAADFIRDEYGLSSRSSSDFANETFIFEILKEKYNYKTKEECYLDRVNKRTEWYDLICDYNKTDKSKLAVKLLNVHDIYIGMRDDKEFEASKYLFDFIIYIDASERIKEFDPTLKIDKKVANIVITNNEGLEDLYEKIRNVMKSLGIQPLKKYEEQKMMIKFIPFSDKYPENICYSCFKTDLTLAKLLRTVLYISDEDLNLSILNSKQPLQLDKKVNKGDVFVLNHIGIIKIQ